MHCLKSIRAVRAAGVLAAILVTAAGLASAARAQVGGAGPAAGAAAPAGTAAEGVITANGSATIERRPDLVRMQLDLSADGKDAKEAVASLRAQEKAAREKLTKIGAAEASVKLDDPHPA